ncbi:MAG: hypothetical protein CM1200mP18_19900 [Gammaproteobacteria bacterium]|nr:MAG: hypothetical protein CM1200mP18_19900 [Gammaproteobacteria bacterium]
MRHWDCVTTERADTYLEAVRAYMPEPHRNLLPVLTVRPSEIASAALRVGQVRALYNSCVQKVVEFRRLHLVLAANYIASRMDNPRGQEVPTLCAG